MTEKLSFVTFFSKDYLIYGLTLIDSVRQWHPLSKVFLFPLDEESRSSLVKKYESEANVKILEKPEINKAINSFQQQGRSRAEAIFTVKPQIIALAVDASEPGSMIFYCDADLYFFGKIPEEMYRDKELVISKHLFQAKLVGHLKYGRFNAGFVGIRNSDLGLAALQSWIKLCIQKCSKVPDENSFADQKYLESFEKYGDVLGIASSIGLNQSLWAFDGEQEIKEGPEINGISMICFHFHGLRAFKDYVATDIDRYGKLSKRQSIIRWIYEPYIESLKKNRESVLVHLEERELSFKERLQPHKFVKWEL